MPHSLLKEGAKVGVGVGWGEVVLPREELETTTTDKERGQEGLTDLAQPLHFTVGAEDDEEGSRSHAAVPLAGCQTGRSGGRGRGGRPQPRRRVRPALLAARCSRPRALRAPGRRCQPRNTRRGPRAVWRPVAGGEGPVPPLLGAELLQIHPAKGGWVVGQSLRPSSQRGKKHWKVPATQKTIGVPPAARSGVDGSATSTSGLAAPLERSEPGGRCAGGELHGRPKARSIPAMESEEMRPAKQEEFAQKKIMTTNPSLELTRGQCPTSQRSSISL
ncbi:uncharacterized protein LOC143690582 [Tamandua tetradactyla]|uniref:uncharacterized protein LOC143690582 n=1 Tax=Tamandua tetradactyla TaxID=48850 RepID=UPI00405490B8